MKRSKNLNLSAEQVSTLNYLVSAQLVELNKHLKANEQAFTANDKAITERMIKDYETLSFELEKFLTL